MYPGSNDRVDITITAGRRRKLFTVRTSGATVPKGFLFDLRNHRQQLASAAWGRAGRHHGFLECISYGWHSPFHTKKEPPINSVA